MYISVSEFGKRRFAVLDAGLVALVLFEMCPEFLIYDRIFVSKNMSQDVLGHDVKRLVLAIKKEHRMLRAGRNPGRSVVVGGIGGWGGLNQAWWILRQLDAGDVVVVVLLVHVWPRSYHDDFFEGEGGITQTTSYIQYITV